MNKLPLLVGVLGMVLILLSSDGVIYAKEKKTLLIDNFTSTNSLSALGTVWRTFTDGVMGGLSKGSSTREVIESKNCLHLTGNVSLANNGGFLQMALDLNKSGRYLDVKNYKGIRMLVRGNGENYYVHIRSADTWLPWQYYYMTFPTSDKWQTVELPFAGFKPDNLKKPINTSKLVSVGIVAAKKEFRADVAIARIEFYN
jgi:hypothetical protein